MDQQAPQHQGNFILFPELLAQLGGPRSRHYRLVKAGLRTEPVKLSARSVGWPPAEVAVMVALQKAGAPPDEVRKVVARLHAERRKASRRILREFTMARAGGAVAPAPRAGEVASV